MAAAGSPSVCELEEGAAWEMCPWNPCQPWLGRCQRAARERWELLSRECWPYLMPTAHSIPIPFVLLSRLNASEA